MQSNRDSFKTLVLLAVAGLAALFIAVSLVTLGSDPEPSVSDSMRRLQEGNARFVADRPQHPSQSAARRTRLAEGQHPYAVVVTCSDSRVPPELLFDAGLGELFVVRSAGHVLEPAAIGSVEYAVEHLHVPLVAVLGHSQCGAVKATMEAVESGAQAEGGIAALVKAITPAVEQTAAQEGDKLANAITAQVRNTMAQLGAARPVLHQAIGGAQVRLVGGVYDLESGRVAWLD